MSQPSTNQLERNEKGMMDTLDWNYPRPDFDRSARWLDLSGTWEFARGPGGPGGPAGDAGQPPAPDRFRESITVPCPWESPASGVAAPATFLDQVRVQPAAGLDGFRAVRRRVPPGPGEPHPARRQPPVHRRRGCFNEEWGLDWKVAADPVRQEVVAQAVALVRDLDDSRPVVDNSGWTHVGGDLVDWHCYEADLERWAKNVDALVRDDAAEIPVALPPDTVTMKPLLAKPDAGRGRPNLNSEYGMGFTSVERGWYLKWQTQELRRHDRLAGYVYTELYDIEHEMAGLFAADRSPKDLGNLSPADANAETVLVLDVLPARPGADLELTGPGPSFQVRCSHHGRGPVRGRLHWAWTPHLAAASGPSGLAGSAVTGGGLPLSAAPFVLSDPVQVTAELPPG